MKKFFKIRNKKWTVMTKEAGTDFLKLDGEPCLGLIHLKSRTIYVDQDLVHDKKEFYETLTHELTHCYLYSFGIDKRTFRDEEFICEFLAIYGGDIVDLSRELVDYFILKSE